MANLASSGVTTLDTWWVVQGGTPGKKRIAKRCKVTLSTMGSATNKILASAFGMAKIFRCSAIVKVDDLVIYSAVPSYDNTFVMVKNHAAVTSLDISGDFVIEVEGEPTAA